MRGGEKEHVTVSSSVRVDVYIKGASSHQVGALRTDLGLIMKKHCAKLELAVLEGKRVSFLSWGHLNCDPMISWLVSGSEAGISRVCRGVSGWVSVVNELCLCLLLKSTSISEWGFSSPLRVFNGHHNKVRV